MARTVVAELTVRAAGFQRGMADAEASARRMSRAAAAEARRVERAWSDVGNASLAMGAAATGALVGVARAAIGWESAWAGVRKTVDGSAEEMAALEGELRGLARTLPATHEEIAGVAEAAGQLGVRREDIADFTRTMVALGETTNLSAEEAATAFAQLANVMGTSGDEIDNLGSALVALGNQGASTEADILSMAQRIAGAGATIGLSETQVLGWAAALANVGIEAEAGGSAISTVFIRMAGAVSKGGDDLEKFAAVAGMSAEQFADRWGRDASGAAQAFVEGLGEINASGGDTLAVMEALEITEIRQRDAVLRLANAQGNLADAQRISGEAARENSALAAEAAERYNTTEAQIQIAWNNIKDAAIEAGSVLLPVIADIAGGVADLARWFAELPGPVKEALVGVTALVAGIGLVGGATIRAVQALASVRAAMTTLGLSAAATSRAMTGMRLALGIGAGVVAFGLAVDALSGAMGSAELGIEGVTRALLDLADGSKNFDAIFEGNAARVDTFAEALDRVADKNVAQSVFDTVFGVIGMEGRGLDQAKRAVEAVDEALANLVRGGNAAEAQAALEGLARDSGRSVRELRDELPQLNDALIGVENDARRSGQAMGAAAGGADTLGSSAAGATAMLEGMSEEAQQQAEALADWIEELSGIVGAFADPLRAYSETFAAAEQSMREEAARSAEAHNQAIDRRISAVQREYQARLDAARATEGIDRGQIREIEARRDAEVAALEDQRRGWEDYADTVTVSVDEWLAALEAQVEAQRDWQRNMLLLAGRVSQGVLDELARMGPEGADLVAALVDAGAEELARMEELFAADTRSATDAVAQQLQQAAPVLRRVAEIAGQDTADGYARRLAEGTTTVAAIAAEYGIALDQGIPDTVTTEARLEGVASAIGSANALEERLASLDGRTATANVRIRITTESSVVAAERSLGQRADGGLLGYASGGWVAYPRAGVMGLAGGGRPRFGPYDTGSGGRIAVGTTGRADDVWFRGSRGEFVVNAVDTARNLDLLRAINAGRPVRVQGYESGGVLGAASAGSTMTNTFNITAAEPRQTAAEVLEAQRIAAWKAGR